MESEDVLMFVRKLTAVSAISAALVVGVATAAFAASGNGNNFGVGSSSCVGSDEVENQTVLETGSAFKTGTMTPATAKWSIWASTTNNFNTATSVAGATAKTVNQFYTPPPNQIEYVWGCIFNNNTVGLDYSIAITP
jgi:hypothetical protein